MSFHGKISLYLVIKCTVLHKKKGAVHQQRKNKTALRKKASFQGEILSPPANEFSYKFQFAIAISNLVHSWVVETVWIDLQRSIAAESATIVATH